MFIAKNYAETKYSLTLFYTHGYKWTKVMLPYNVGGGLPVVGGGGSVTSQSIAFKYVMASEPFRNT
jgi:hypothetical protein